MNLENQLSDKEFEEMFLLELIKMCSDNGFDREAIALFNILETLNSYSENKNIIH